MVFDPASATHLKPWLIRALEPICDAEPGALADYILALLKHNVPEAEMRKEMQVQLEEFLENECAPFLDTLFTVLRTKSYLPYSTEPPPSSSKDEGIPIPLDGVLAGSSSKANDRTRKRSLGDDGDVRPAKGARLSTDGDFSRQGHGGQWAGQQGMGGFGMGMPGMGMGVQSGRQAGYRPPGSTKRGICRDYHNHGFCARGETCKYSHGDDAVIPSQLYSMVPPPMMPFFYNMFNQGSVPYDPNDPRGGRPDQRTPLMPRAQQEQHTNATGELPVIQDLTPQGEGSAQQGSQQEQQSQQQGMAMPPPHALAAMMQGFDPSMFSGVPPNMAGMPFPLPGMDPNAQPSSESSNHPGQPSFRGRGGRPQRGRGGGGASEASSFRPGQRSDKTLVVEKIPEDKLSLDQITTWFKKFGDVTNVAVDHRGSKALVSFATHDEARAAWKSEDAVFNNRFVKVFWHRPMEGHGQVGQRALAASANLVSNLSGKQGSSSTPSSSQPGPSTSSATAKKQAPSAAASALAAKQELLEGQIAEQKSLMDELSTAAPDRKKQIMARLRKLNEEMTAAKNAETTAAPLKKPISRPVSKEGSTEVAIDKDTEMQAPDGGEETTDQLKAKLEKLKAEAASLGISPDASAESSYGGYRGGYRGRGRGRGAYYRGAVPVMRGGPPRGSLKLDNRPKKLLVKGVSEDSGKQAVREWYEALGQVENIENLDNGDVLVSFKSRAAAEQGLAKGQHIPGLGKVQVSWHTAKPATSTPAPTSMTPASAAGSSSMQVDKEIVNDTDRIRNSTPDRSLQDDEEPVATGWGEDDGMGF